ncbi:MAG: dTMP kinase [Caldilineaceae bacterium]
MVPKTNHRSRGLFITFEGPEGSGKSTQIQLLSRALEARGLCVLATREPGGTHIGEQIRAIVLDTANTEMSPRAETLLYNAARAQIVDQVIMPALERGTHVLCDRYADSTLAYQGFGHGQSVAQLRQLGDYATNGLKPDITIYLDIAPEVGLRRKQTGDSEGWNRFEQLELAYHRAVHQGYLQLAQDEPERWQVVDAERDESVIHQDILARIKSLGLIS